MIRPLTIATCLLACGSGLYLYQSKHEVQLLDRTIERTVHDTNAMREQSRLLAAEWTMLNDPDRLRQFSDTYLALKSIAPTQFVSLTDLDGRLPAPRAEVPSHGTDDQAPVATVSASEPDPAPGASPAEVADEELPLPPIPVPPPAPVVASTARPPGIRIPDRPAPPRAIVADGQARPVAIADTRAVAVADARAFDQRPLDPRQFEQRPPDQHPVVPRLVDERVAVGAQPFRPIVLGAPNGAPNGAPRPPLPANGPVYGPPAIVPSQPPASGPPPYSGSLLGMARGAMPPAPRPTPVVATYNAN